MSVNSELSALLTKMGGTPLESDSNSDLIKKISAAYEGGGSGAGGVTIVHVTVDLETEDGTLDMKAGELLAACTNGPVFILANTEGAASSFCTLIEAANFSNGVYSFRTGFQSFAAESADEYPTASGDK